MASRVVQATPEQAAQGREAAARFQQKASAVTRAVVGRYAFTHSLLDLARQYNIDPAAFLSPSLLAANDKADSDAAKWAAIVRGLDKSKAELALWAEEGEQGGGTLRLGVVRAGTLPTKLDLWPIVPVVVYTVGAAFTVGTWLLVDAWLEAETIEAEAAKLDAQNRKAITDLVAEASKQSPAMGAQLADALARAQQAASAAQAKPQGILDKLAGLAKGAYDFVGGATTGMGVGAILLLALLASKGGLGGLFGKRGRKRA